MSKKNFWIPIGFPVAFAFALCLSCLCLLAVQMLGKLTAESQSFAPIDRCNYTFPSKTSYFCFAFLLTSELRIIISSIADGQCGFLVNGYHEKRQGESGCQPLTADLPFGLQALGASFCLSALQL